MLPINAANARLWSMLGSRGTFGAAILDVAGDYDRFVVLTADLCNSSGLDRFRTAYPERLINVGIAEQNLIGVAAGLAKEGYNAFVTTFSDFAATRSCEQIRLNLGYMGLNVKVIGLAGGLALGPLGNTHFGTEDMALMRAIPNLTVVAPADGVEIFKLVRELVVHNGPVFVRLTGGVNNPIVYKNDYVFSIGKSIRLRDGDDVAIFASGTMVFESLEAAKNLDAVGISAAVINMHTLKPLDLEAIESACQTASLLVTVEEHSLIGGLGGAVAEFVAQRGNAPRLLCIGLPDQFGKHGDYQYLLRKYGLTGAQIANKVAAGLSAHSPGEILAAASKAVPSEDSEALELMRNHD